MRFKKSILAELNYETIQDELYEICEQCADVRYFFSEDDTLLNALDGDEEEEFEFKMMFSELDGESERLLNMLNDMYVTEHFDDFFVGLMSKGGSNFNVLGFDTYEEDYFHLTEFEKDLAVSEAGKRLMRLTKSELLSITGQCFGVAMSFFNIRQKYDYLKTAFDILRDDNTSFLKVIKEIETAYEKADEEDFNSYSKQVQTFDRLIADLPERVWLE
jgi:hypothetical protein